MIPVGNHGLACLSSEDYGAIALYMQETAFDVEAALIGEQDALNRYRLRTSIEVVTTVTTSTVAGAGSSMPDGRVAQGMDWTGATVLGGGSPVTLLTGGGTIIFTPALSGWYDIGVYSNMIAAGAVTVGSERVIYIQMNQTPDLPATNANVFFQERVTDTNTGGEFLQVSGLVYLVGGRTANFQVLFSHANVASNLVAQIGSKAWIAYYGPKGGLVVNA